jgi:hypothetical protein
LADDNRRPRRGALSAAPEVRTVRQLESQRGSRLNISEQRRFGRNAPESGRIMLTLSFVVPDPKRTSA